MKLFTVKLTDDERAGLEAYRAQHGLRSQADAVRRMIAVALAPQPAHAVRAALEADIERRTPRTDAVLRRLPDNTKSIDDPVNRVHLGPAPSVPGSRLKQTRRP